MWMKVAVAAALLLILIPVVALALFGFFARKPTGLGVTEGHFAPCPESPNCVCSEATDDAHRIDPIPYLGDSTAALGRLVEVIEGLPRTKLVTQNESYLHVEFTSALFRYVDDVEFRVDAAENQIHVRSASRAGHSDFGANRKRVESIRTAVAGHNE